MATNRTRSAPNATDRAEPTPLFQVDTPQGAPGRRGRRPTGRHEKALAATVRALGLGVPSAAARVSLLRSLAAALDLAETKADPYATAAAARVYFDALAKSGLMGELAVDQDELAGLDGGPELDDDAELDDAEDTELG